MAALTGCSTGSSNATASSTESASSASASPTGSARPSASASSTGSASASPSASPSASSSAAPAGTTALPNGSYYSPANSVKLAQALGNTSKPTDVSLVKRLIQETAIQLKPLTTTPAACAPLARTSDLYAMPSSTLAVATDEPHGLAVTATVLPKSAPSLTSLAQELKQCASYTVNVGGKKVPYTAGGVAGKDGDITYFTSTVSGGTLVGNQSYQVIAETKGIRIVVSALNENTTLAKMEAVAKSLAEQVSAQGSAAVS